MFDPKTRKHVFLGYDSKGTAYLLKDIETRKLTRARNVVFYEKKLVGFTNELRVEESNLLFDLTFGDEIEAEDKKIIVTVKQ